MQRSASGSKEKEQEKVQEVQGVGALSAGRVKMLLRIRQVIALDPGKEVLCFGASKELEYPYLCTGARNYTLVSLDNNDKADILQRLGRCAGAVTAELEDTVRGTKRVLRVRVPAHQLPVSIRLHKCEYGKFRRAVPSKRYDCLVDKASWLYEDYPGWGDYLYRLKDGGYCVTDFDYTHDGSAPWVLDMFGLWNVTHQLKAFKGLGYGYGYSGDTAFLFTKSRDYPRVHMELAMTCYSRLKSILDVYKLGLPDHTGLYLDWQDFQRRVDSLQDLLAFMRRRDRMGYNQLIRTIMAAHTALSQWVTLHQNED